MNASKREERRTQWLERYNRTLERYARERVTTTVQHGHIAFRIVKVEFDGHVSHGAEITTNGVTTISWKSPASLASARACVRRAVRELVPTKDIQQQTTT